LAALARRPGLTTLQITGFGLGILALLLLAIVRVDLLESWHASLPEGTPDHFALNILPEDVDAFRQTLETRSIRHSGVYPMIRARLAQIGDRRIEPRDYESPRARRLAAREYNLSRAVSIQSDNKIVKGQWWQSNQHQEPWFSVESGLAQALGIKLGDILTFEAAGEFMSGKVTSLREVRWDSFNVNFFVIGTPGLMAGLPASYVSSFHLPPDRESLLAELAGRFPATSVIDVKPLMAHIRSVLDQGVKAVEAVFLFTLAAGALVLYAAVQASRQERASETAVLRTLGAPRSRLLSSVLAEFSALGLLSGLLASAMASAIGYTLARQVFDLPWSANPWLWVAGIGLGVIGVTAAGLVATWRVIHTPPTRVLQSRFS
jgi:putative ABC transport system permease protein